MQETKRDPAEVAREEKLQKEREKLQREREKLQKERETIAFEHDYFARPGGKTEPMGPCDDETDSAEEGEKVQVRNNLFNLWHFMVVCFCIQSLQFALSNNLRTSFAQIYVFLMEENIFLCLRTICGFANI